MKKEAFPNEIFVRYECHVVKYIINENETTGGGKYYHIAERSQSQHVHFENTLYFEGNVPETITVFRSERNALNAAGYYAQSKVNEIENRIKKLA